MISDDEFTGEDTQGFGPEYIDSIIQEAAGIVLSEFTKRHPATYHALKKQMATMEFLIEALKQDATYVALVEQTESELDIAAVTKVLIGVAFRLAETFVF